MIDHKKARQLAEEIYADIEGRAVIKHEFQRIKDRKDKEDTYDEIIDAWADLITEWTQFMRFKEEGS